MEITRRASPRLSCNVQECSKTKIKARGMCGTHYDRWWAERQTGVAVVPRAVKSVRACTVHGCEDVATVRSDGRVTCRKHEARWRRTGSYEKHRGGAKPGQGTIPYKGECSVDGCTREARSVGGVCNVHHGRWQRNKSFDAVRDVRQQVPDMTVDNLLERTELGSDELTEGCLLWTGRVDKQGYAYDYDPALYRAGKPATKFIHRRIYELIHGEGVIGDLTIDHRCHDPNRCRGGVTCPHRRCINPEHLVPETRGANARRHSPIQRELSLLDINDPDAAAEHIRAQLFKPCGHLQEKHGGPRCSCDQKLGAAK